MIAIIEPDQHQAHSLWAHLGGTFYEDELEVFNNAYEFLTSPRLDQFEVLITEQRLPFTHPNPDMENQASLFPQLTFPEWDRDKAGSRLIEYLRKNGNDIFAIIYTTDDIPQDEDDNFVSTVDERTVKCYKTDNWRSLDAALNS